jgi:hypothetical protein
MRHRDIYDYEPEPDHPAKRERPHDIAPCTSTRLNGTTSAESARTTARPRSSASGRCRSSRPSMWTCSARTPRLPWQLSITWGEFCETSPHRPRTEKEREEWGLKVLPEFANIPRDWMF